MGQAVEVSGKVRVLIHGIEFLVEKPKSWGWEDETHAWTLGRRRGGPPWTNFDLVLFPDSVFCGNRHRAGRSALDSDLLLARVKEARNLADQGGAACCLYQHIPDRYDRLKSVRGESGVTYPEVYEPADRCVSTAYMAELGIDWRETPRGLTTHTSVRPEFDQFLRDYAAGNNTFRLPEGFDGCTLCTHDGSTTGFQHGGWLFLLPCHLEALCNAEDRAHAAFQAAATAVLSYRRNTSVDPPPWIDDVRFTAEEPLHEARSTLQGQLAGVQASIAEFARFKRVLYLGDDPLVDSVKELLGWIEIQTRREERYREDLWLLGADGQPAAIVEVKGVSANVQGRHVLQVPQHREQYGLEEGFPGLLVANTFRTATSLAAKDVQIELKIIQHACYHNVLVLRTLDLFRFVDRVRQDLVQAAELLQQLGSGGGWLEVPPEGPTRLHQA